MGEITLYDTEPEFVITRDEGGDVQLIIRPEGTTIRVSVGRVYDRASLLAQSLHHLAEDLDEEILDQWEDTPDEFDAYITVERGRYHVSLDGTRVGDYPSQDLAELELARAMVPGGVFPNAWLVTDHGNTLDINDNVRRWHNQAGDAMAPVEGRAVPARRPGPLRAGGLAAHRGVRLGSGRRGNPRRG
jgi:hypothetical protein